MENYDQRVIIFFALCPLSYAIIRGVISGKKVMSGKLQKELTEMNSKTRTLLCWLFGLATCAKRAKRFSRVATFAKPTAAEEHVEREDL